VKKLHIAHHPSSGPGNMLKCNINVVVFSLQKGFGIGLFVRNDRGFFVKAKIALFYGFIPTVEDCSFYGFVKAKIALCHAISWLADLGFDNIIFEMDCKLVVDDMRETCLV